MKTLKLIDFITITMISFLLIIGITSCENVKSSNTSDPVQSKTEVTDGSGEKPGDSGEDSSAGEDSSESALDDDDSNSNTEKDENSDEE